jgi:hypothetical protein
MDCRLSKVGARRVILINMSDSGIVARKVGVVVGNSTFMHED